MSKGITKEQAREKLSGEALEIFELIEKTMTGAITTNRQRVALAELIAEKFVPREDYRKVASHHNTYCTCTSIL